MTTNVIEMDSLARARERRAEEPLKCVASRQLSGGCSCQATVPSRVATVAWSSAQGYGDRGLTGGFFHFAWGGETWLAFGLPGGEVRGVFCPAHRLERESLALKSA